MSAGATIAYLRECLQTPELRAFLRVVRAGESHPELDEAYRAMFGWRPGNGQVFTSFDDHPRQAFKSAWGWTSAAGAYQAMAAVPGKVKTDTWGDYVKWCAGQGHVPTFTPAEQDLFGAWCVVIRRRAMPALLARDLEHAIALCNREWASLPGSPYGQPLMSMDKARAVWRTWLARFEAPAIDTSAGPVETPAPDERDAYQAKEDSAAGDPAEYPQPPEQPTMAPLLLGALKFGGSLVGALAQNLAGSFAPLAQEKLAKELGRHTSSPQVAEQVATAMIETVKAATGKDDPIEAVAAAKADPTVMQQAQDSALDTLDRLAPLLDKMHQWSRDESADLEASRAAAAIRAREDAADLAPMLATYAVRGLYGMIALLAVLVGVQMYFAADHKPAGELVGALVSLIMLAAGKSNTVYDYRFGTSRSSAAKDVVIGELSMRKTGTQERRP